MSSEHSVTSIIPSDIDAVDPAEALVRQFARSLGFDDSDQYDIALAAREIIINAIKHGNRFQRESVPDPLRHPRPPHQTPPIGAVPAAPIARPRATPSPYETPIPYGS